MISIFLLLIRLDEGDHWGCFYSRSANVGAEAWRAETLLKATRKESGRKKNPTHRVCSHPPGLSLWPVPPLSPGAWTCSSFDKGPWAFQSSKEVASAPAAGLGQCRAQHYRMPESESARGLRGHGTRCPHRRGPGNKSCAERNESEINRIVSNPEILQRLRYFCQQKLIHLFLRTWELVNIDFVIINQSCCKLLSVIYQHGFLATEICISNRDCM